MKTLAKIVSNTLHAHPLWRAGFYFAWSSRTAKSEKKNHLKFAIQSSSLAVMRPETGVLGTRLLSVDLAGQPLKPESESLLQIRTPQLGGGACPSLFLAKIVSSLRQRYVALSAYEIAAFPPPMSHIHSDEAAQQKERE